MRKIFFSRKPKSVILYAFIFTVIILLLMGNSWEYFQYLAYNLKLILGTLKNRYIIIFAILLVLESYFWWVLRGTMCWDSCLDTNLLSYLPSSSLLSSLPIQSLTHKSMCLTADPQSQPIKTSWCLFCLFLVTPSGVRGLFLLCFCSVLRLLLTVQGTMLCWELNPGLPHGGHALRLLSSMSVFHLDG